MTPSTDIKARIMTLRKVRETTEKRLEKLEVDLIRAIIVEDEEARWHPLFNLNFNFWKK